MADPFRIAVLGALLIAWTGSPAAAQETEQPEPAAEIPLELFFSRPLVRATIDGDAVALLVDPETRTTRIAPDLAERLELGRGDVPPAVTLGLGDTTAADVPVEVRDTADLLPEVRAHVPLAGVLSLSVWPDQLVTLDYRRWLLRIESGALPEPDGRTVFALQPETGELYMDVAVGDHVITCRVDPWFPGGLLLPSSYLTGLPILGNTSDPRRVATRGGMVSVREAQLSASVTVADVEHALPLVLFGNVGDVGLVGYQWLSRLSVTYDRAHARARLAIIEPEDPSAAPDTPVATLSLKP